MIIKIDGKETTLIEIFQWENDWNIKAINSERNGYKIRIYFHNDYKEIEIYINNIDVFKRVFRLDYIGRDKNNDYEAINKMIKNIVGRKGGEVGN